MDLNSSPVCETNLWPEGLARRFSPEVWSELSCEGCSKIGSTIGSTIGSKIGSTIGSKMGSKNLRIRAQMVAAKNPGFQAPQIQLPQGFERDRPIGPKAGIPVVKLQMSIRAKTQEAAAFSATF
jgi:hypothetical protein